MQYDAKLNGLIDNVRDMLSKGEEVRIPYDQIKVGEIEVLSNHFQVEANGEKPDVIIKRYKMLKSLGITKLDDIDEGKFAVSILTDDEFYTKVLEPNEVINRVKDLLKTT